MLCYRILVLFTIFLIVPAQLWAFPLFDEHTLADTLDSPSSSKIIDIDLDGDLDLLFTDTRDDAVLLYEKTGLETYRSIIISDSLGRPRDVDAVDIDGDGDIDIISTGYDSRFLAWWENDGEGGFSSHYINNDIYGICLDIADLNADNRPDIIATDREAGYLLLYINLGEGEFLADTVGGDLGSLWEAKCADLDNDDDLDIIATAEQDTGMIYCWINQNNADLELQLISEEVGAIRGLTFVDMNEDGLLDFAIADRSLNQIALWRNTGGMNFEMQALVDELNSVRDVEFEDFDNDGDLDLAVAVYSDDDVICFENVGNGDFEARLLEGSFDGAVFLDKLDFDSDGDTDLIGGSYRDGLLHWYENKSPTGDLVLDRLYVDMGMIQKEEETTADLTLFYDSDYPNADQVRVTYDVIVGDDWLDVDMEADTIELGDDLNVSVIVNVPHDYPSREITGQIRISTLEQVPRVFNVRIDCLPIEGFGSIGGTVTDALTGNPLPDALVYVENIDTMRTNEDGEYFFREIPAMRLNVTASAPDFRLFREEDIRLDINEEMVLDIELLYATCELTIDTLYVELSPDQVTTEPVRIENNGSDRLHVEIGYNTPHSGPFGDWEQIDVIYAEQETGDDQIQGVEFADHLYFVTGGNSDGDTPQVWIFDDYGELQGSFDQFGDSRWGMRDLAWDGNLLWGSDGSDIYGFTTAGELVNVLETQLDLNRAITWDDAWDCLWFCDVSSDLIAMDTTGQILAEISVPDDYHIYGLGALREEPHGYRILAFCLDGDEQTRVVSYNPGGDDWEVVVDLNSGGMEIAGGMSITADWSPATWLMACVLRGIDGDEDKVVLWNAQSRDVWFSPENREINVAPGFPRELDVEVSTVGLDVGMILNGELKLIHDGRGDSLVLPIQLAVVAEDAINTPDYSPPTGYALLSSYPNPFNSTTTISYSLPANIQAQLTIYNTRGQLVDVLVNRVMPVGAHSVVWEADGVSAGVYLVRMNELTQKLILLR